MGPPARVPHGGGHSSVHWGSGREEGRGQRAGLPSPASFKRLSHLCCDLYALMSRPNSQRRFTGVDSEAQRSGQEPGGPGAPDSTGEPWASPLSWGALGPGEL